MFPVSDSIVHLDARRTRLFSIACFAFLLLSLVLAILPSSARATDEASTAAAASSAVSTSSADTQSAVPSATLVSGSTTFAPVAEPTPRRTIRAGLADMDTNGGANRTVEFEKDYLQAIAEYANWDIEYVYAPWADCLQMVENGDVDVLLDVTMTDDRLSIYDFSAESMGTEMCYLYGRADTTLQYDDYASFNGMTVGYESGSTIIEALQQFSQEKGFTFNTKSYASGADMFAALDAGEVDAVAQTNFYDTPAGHVVLTKCAPTPVYLVTYKGDPTLKSELDDAMTQLLSYCPSFNADIFDRHFATITSQASGYTQEELAYLATSPVVKVYYETSWEPLEYNRNGVASGITPDIIRAIGADTGIDFEFVLFPSTGDIYSDIDSSSSDTRDTVMAVSYSYIWANSHDLLVTQPYIASSVTEVTRTADMEVHSVALAGSGYIASHVKDEYPELEVTEYPTFAECMDAVKRGDVDCTFVNDYQASYYRSADAYGNLSYQPDANIEQSISLGVTRESNPALFGIISKSLQRLSASTVQGIVNDNTVQTNQFTLNRLISRYPLQTTLIIGAIGILIGLLAVLLVTSRSRRLKNLQLEAANNAKSDFLSRMSHDIRTPMNGIIGMTEIAREQDNPPATTQCLDKIDRSSQFLLGLVNDILDMSKAESGKMELHPEPYPIDDFKSYLDSVIRPLCEGKGQTLRIKTAATDGIVPIIDILRYNQIMFNLLSNAVKYTPEGGTISLDVTGTLLADHKEHIVATVSDNGIGMSAEFREILFEPFSQEARRDNSDNRGSGLGLSIVKRIVDLMGGTIVVESELGKGSTFTVTVDFDCIEASQVTESEAAKSEKNADYTQLAGRHVLLCEDHPLNTEIAVHLLERQGMVVTTAEDGRAGMKEFGASPIGYYDIILMDVRMPVMDGLEATRRIRALERADAATVPIVAMTADAYEEDIRRCLDAGMNAHVPKPIDSDALLSTLVQQL